MKNLKNKTVLITGGTSGIGLSCAHTFAEAGCNIIITGRREDRLEKISKELASKYRIQCAAIKMDVRDFENVKQGIDSITPKQKKIDILINNAGLSRGINKIQDGLLEDWNEMIDTNVKGILHVSKCVIPLMLENKTGHIINIGSIAGQEVYPGGNIYSASKFAVDGITKSMRVDLLETPIKVSTVDPGLVKTEFSIVRFHGDEEKAEAPYKGIEPLSPEDVADAVLYIATRKDNVNIAQIVMFPKAQAGTTFINRGK
ncbi:SDR family NAD(P)-dependent oxidoreductase [soil metagenome]